MSIQAVNLKTIKDRCEEVGECWNWKQAKTSQGYPRITLKNAPSQYAHITAWIVVHGPLLPGQLIRRKCDNRACCNPAHLRIMSRKQQNQLAAKRGGWKGVERRLKLSAAARKLRGKLDPQKARAIRMSDDPAPVLAKRYDVSVTLIYRVLRNEVWIDAAPNASVFHQAA